MALRQGWTEEELTEVLLHLSGYVGVAIIRESMMVASKVWPRFVPSRPARNNDRLKSTTGLAFARSPC
jgi:hypothetical protein